MFLKKAEMSFNLVDLQLLNKPSFSNDSCIIDQNLEFNKRVLADTISVIKVAQMSDVKEARKEIDGDATNNFDLEAEIKNHPDSLFVKCFAIKADEMNDNGDYFEKEPLKLATSTFVGVPIFTNHQNTDINQARGKVIHSWWDESRNGIMIIARVDAEAYPQLARGIKEQYVVGTSMGCSVHHSLCSICHNSAETPDQYCFEKETPILMSDFTTKRICDIQIGDEVIDAYGQLTKVTRLFKHSINEKALILKSRAISGELICTKNHPFLVDSRGEYRFFPAEYLADKQTLFTPVPKIKQDNSFFKIFGIDNLSKDNKKKFIRLLGYYGAEGSRIIRNGKIQAIEITFNKDEHKYIDDVVDICESVFNKSPSVYQNYYTKNTTRIRLWFPEIAQKISGEICPGIVHRERSKKYHKSIFTLTDEYITELLSSFTDGDGHCDANNSIVIHSACDGLASQLYYLFIKIGISPSMNVYSNKGGPFGRDKEFKSYRVHVGNSQITQINESEGGTKLAKAKNKKSLQSKLTNVFTEDELFTKHSLYSIEEINFVGDVYNFETESHSYVANNTSVHNCEHIRERKTRLISARNQKCSYHKFGTDEKCPICGCKKGEVKSFSVEKKAFEYNYGIKFIENSFVVNPACHSCGVTEVIDPQKFLQKASSIMSLLPRLVKAAESHFQICDDKQCVKIAGKQELDSLTQALDLVSSVSQSMLKQKAQIDLEFCSDLVKVLSDLQTVTDELTQQGYGSLPSPGAEENPQQNAQGQGQPQMPQSQVPSIPTATAAPSLAPSKEIGGPAGSVAKVTGPMAAKKFLDIYKKAKNIFVPIRQTIKIKPHLAQGMPSLKPSVKMIKKKPEQND